MRIARVSVSDGKAANSKPLKLLPATPDLIRGRGEGDHSPQSEWWRGGSPAKAGAQARKRSRKAVADDEDIPDLIAAK